MKDKMVGIMTKSEDEFCNYYELNRLQGERYLWIKEERDLKGRCFDRMIVMDRELCRKLIRWVLRSCPNKPEVIK